MFSSLLARFSRRLPYAGAAIVLLVAAACSEPAPPPPPPAPPVKTPQERAQIYQSCWSQFNSKDWDNFGKCYTDNAVSESPDSASTPTTTGRAAIIDREKKFVDAFPDRKGELQLVLVNGSRTVGVATFTATNSGPMPGPDGKPMPATNKTIGFPMAHRIDWDPTGAMAADDAGYVEEGTMMGQLGVTKNPVRKAMQPTGAATNVVIAKNDDAERANVAAVQSMLAAFNSHDAKAMEALMADDYMLMEVAQPKDMNKKESIASTKEFMKAFPDIQITPAATWGAGDYVVIEGSIAGTNKAPMPAMGIMKATNKPFKGRFMEVMKVTGGKVQNDWLFYNSSAFVTQLGLK